MSADRRLVIGTVYHVVGLRLTTDSTLFDVTLEDDNGEIYEVQADRDESTKYVLGARICLQMLPSI